MKVVMKVTSTCSAPTITAGPRDSSGSLIMLVSKDMLHLVCNRADPTRLEVCLECLSKAW